MRLFAWLLLSQWAAGGALGAQTVVSSVVAWGDNRWGQTNVPPKLTNAVAIAAGENHSLALKSDGMVVAWGQNDDTGGVPTGRAIVPAGLRNVVAIAGGSSHSLALIGIGPPSTSLKLLPPHLLNDGLTIPFTTLRGKVYHLESKFSLTDAHWQFQRGLAGDGSVKSFAEPIASAGHRFYRVWQQP